MAFRSFMATNLAVCEALGLDPAKTRTIDLRFTPGDLPRLVVEQLVHDEDVDGLVSVFKTFDLVARDEETDRAAS